MEGVVAEALRAKAARGDHCEGIELLGPKALDRRVWYADGSERRLRGHTSDVMTVAECEGRVCSGSLDGSIRVWSMQGEATDEAEQTLVPEGARDAVICLSVWGSLLISGHGSGKLRVWTLATGACEQVLDGHTQRVCALAVCGSRLASSYSGGSIKVWAMGEAAPWTCERTLLGHTDWVRSMATWQGKVLSGSDDRSIRVWDIETGEQAATLVGHEGYVMALAVHCDRLFSTSCDGTIRVWGLGTWAALRTVQVLGRGTGQYPLCLAVSGSHLISGLHTNGDPRGVLVWSLETLELLHTLTQTNIFYVKALLVKHGAVWAGVGSYVVVWGR